jgi:hypothetical protein
MLLHQVMVSLMLQDHVTHLLYLQRGGGVALIRKTTCYAQRVTFQCNFSTFEYVSAEFRYLGHHLIVISLRRPGSDPVSAQFFDEVTKLVDNLSVYICPVMVLGDFNIHVEQLCNALVSQFLSILERFDMRQQVDCPTHRLHGVLDLVITQCTSMVAVADVQEHLLSDHSVVYGSVTWPLAHFVAPDKRQVKKVRA